MPDESWQLSEEQRQRIAIQHGLASLPSSLNDLTKEAHELAVALDIHNPQRQQQEPGARFMDQYVAAQTLKHYPDSELARYYTAKYPEFSEKVTNAIEQHRSRQHYYGQEFGY